MNSFGKKQKLFHIKLASDGILGEITASRPHNRLLWAVGTNRLRLVVGGKTHQVLMFIEGLLAKRFSCN